ncbi:MAG: tRNA(adenine34) deaminase [Alphaproteobacteria bacterium]|jgi:tRNA(adenine34) deaminase
MYRYKNESTKLMKNTIEMIPNQHEYFMEKAIEQAKLAEQIGEIPVGAVVVLNQQIIGSGYNRSITDNDPSLHAEMVAIRNAAKALENYRLIGASIYVTLEPCSMCAGLLVHSRLKQLIYGASDLKTGAAGSVMNIVQHDMLNHKVDVIPGVLGDVCSEHLSQFFSVRRAQIKARKAALRNSP